MAAVADLERLLERLFERTSARLFRSRIQDVQVQRRVERAMEAGRIGRGSNTVVPNRFRVRLNPVDLDDLASRSGGHEALAASLGERALAFARLHSYHLAARPTVTVVADPIVERGTMEVDASVSRSSARAPEAGAAPLAASPLAASPLAASPLPSTPAEPPTPERVLAPVSNDDLAALVGAAPPPAQPPARPSVAAAEAMPVPPPDVAGRPLPPATPLPPAPDPGLASPPVPAPAQFPSAPPLAPVSASVPETPPRTPTQPHSGLRHTPDVPYAVRPAAPPPARALLRVTEPGGREREVRVEDGPLTLGRAPDNGLVIADARISRHHGRFQNRHGTLVYTDLGSTNGTRVNGIRVDEIVLGAGDRLQVGDAVVVVEQLPR